MTDSYGLLSLPAAAAQLGVTSATLRQQIALGRLQGIKLGHEWLVTEDEVRRYRAESLGRPGRRKRVPDR